MHVVLGTNEAVPFALRDFAAYYRAVRSRFLRMVDEKRETYPYPVAHCRLCGYTAACDQRWRHDDHLSLVAGIRRDQVVRLNTAGVTTVKDLAAFETTARIGIMPPTLERLARQADLQVAARTTGHRYELLRPERLRGFGLLPEPSTGDLFFDMEGYPYFESTRGLEYLFGVMLNDGAGWRFKAFECLDRAGEKLAFEQFIDFVYERLLVDPGLHIYHYASYEPATLKRLMGQHVTREAEVDDLLRREVFTDLYQVVRQSMQISHESYSLKAVRQFFMAGAGQGAVTEGGESILEFHRFLETGDTSILAAIRTYNQEDCESTRQLRDWLLARKAEAETQFGIHIPWATVQGRDPDKPLETDDENRELRERLLAIATEIPSSGRDRAACAGLLAYLVDYHRREARPEWWAFFDRLKKSLDDLLEDPQAVAYLEPAPGIAVVPEKRSLLHTMNFPRQEFKLGDEARVVDPVGGGPVGVLVSIDSDGILVLKRGDTLKDVVLPRAIASAGPLKDVPQREALVRVAEAAIDGTAEYRAGRDVLARRAPRILGVAGGAPFQTPVLKEQQSLVARLDDSYLFIQGPPGSGKTYRGARLIVSLLAKGKRIAVAATSHKSIHNLLDEVVIAAREEGVPVTGLKKGTGRDETSYDRDGFENSTRNEECESSDAPLIAGTAWLFAREGMEGKFDYLFIDEAGQVSLADAVAMSVCARNLVLLGDPQQLPHVTQGIHPEGAGCSVLEHLLLDRATVAPDRGLFLEQSWRMHPDVCGFISELAYDGRLHAAPGCERQKIESAGLSGTGLRFLPVEHSGNVQQSLEEAAAIAVEVRRLLSTGTVTDREGQTRPLTASDILVVAPYNMQVRCLEEALPAGVEAGTVDKFQGREAAVVFFSMATSTADDTPRGLEFLFSRNRFNVAISRAKCLAILTCSPRLLDTRCRTVEQMRLVNSVCRFVEVSTC
jgi:predicted RecB family nuclease